MGWRAVTVQGSRAIHTQTQRDIVAKAALSFKLRGTLPCWVGAAQGLVENTGRVLVTDAAARDWLNTAIESISRILVQRHRGEVTPFIEQQLAKWTKEEMSDRIELAIGRDLQFIRPGIPSRPAS